MESWSSTPIAKSQASVPLPGFMLKTLSMIGCAGRSGGLLGLLLAISVETLAVRAPAAPTEERQVTRSAKNHVLDNNDNFSFDGRFLCYDTREVLGPEIGNSRSVEMVEIATGKETILYEAREFVSGAQAAPGVAAVSFSPVENKVVFIHGPPLDQVPARGYYGKPNRQGAEVATDGKGELRWLDKHCSSRMCPLT